MLESLGVDGAIFFEAALGRLRLAFGCNGQLIALDLDLGNFAIICPVHHVRERHLLEVGLRRINRPKCQHTQHHNRPKQP